MKGFRAFLLRGNVIDLAVAVAIGAAFTGIVTAVVVDLLTPLVTAVGGQQKNFQNLKFSINGSPLKYGDFLNKLISFVVLAAVIYFLVVLPVNKLLAYIQRNKAATERPCPECLSQIPVAARRCKFCTAVVGAPGQPGYGQAGYGQAGYGQAGYGQAR